MMDLILVGLLGIVVGGLLGYVARGVWDGGSVQHTASRTPIEAPGTGLAPGQAPPTPEWGHVCVLVDIAGRVVSYRQVARVPTDFVQQHGRGANRTFVRDGEDAEGRPRFRVVT